MAVASGTCPSCGAPIEFGLGSSIAKVCPFCRSTVCRTDRGLENLGKVADLANVPSLIAVGDEGTLAGRRFSVVGRLQLDHGAGPWDEYYVAFDSGQSWGWLAHAEGRWLSMAGVPGIAVPAYNALELEQDVDLGTGGVQRVGEIKVSKVLSAEGELPDRIEPGATRYYADCYGANNTCATFDYGDGQGAYTVFAGFIIPEDQLSVTALGPRTTQDVATDTLACPNCGGNVPKLSGDRSRRIGCPYCGAVSDIALQQVVAQQEAALKLPDIPIGSRGTFDGVEYICLAYLRRGADYGDGIETWEEYLIFAQSVGYRWIVKADGEWLWVLPVNLAEVDISQLPSKLKWGGKRFQLRNQNTASVLYVLGEVYWTVEVGETVRVADYMSGRDVISREQTDAGREVHYSFASPVAWPVIAQGFGLDVNGPGGMFASPPRGSDFSGGDGDDEGGSSLVGAVVLLVVLLICFASFSEGGVGGVVYGGSGYYGGGK